VSNEVKDLVPIAELSVAGMGNGNQNQMLDGGGALMGTDNLNTRTMARSLPRNEQTAYETVMARAKRMKTKAFYAWAVKNKDKADGMVMGPTIDLAMTVVQLWGNCVLIPKIIDESPTHLTVAAIFTDLETGVTISRMFRQDMVIGNFGKMDAARARDINFQIAQSKALRNVVCAAIPEYFFEDAIAAARAEDMGPDPKRILSELEMEKLAESFVEYNVSVAMIDAKLGHEMWTAEDRTNLRGVYKAIKEGQTSVANEFPPVVADTGKVGTEESPLFGGEVEPSKRAQGK